MGRSFIGFRDKGFFLNDGHLELLLHLLAKEIDRLPEVPPWLHELQRHWRLQSVIGATGCVWPGLDDHLTTSDRVAIALDLAQSVRRSIIERSSPWSEEEAVNERGRAVRLMGDVPNTWVVQGAEALIKLLKNELQPDDGSLVLPKIEFYEKIAPKDPCVQSIALLWLALERERFTPDPEEAVLERLAREPWESRCPRIRRAWDNLTAPANLQALGRWADLIGANAVSNRAAGPWAKQALEDCRGRAGKSSDTGG